MMAFSEAIEKVVLIALEIRQELVKFLKSKRFTIREPKKRARSVAGGTHLSKQYRDRLEGALEGIWLGIGYLRTLTPDVLDKTIEQYLMASAEAEGPFGGIDLGAQAKKTLDVELADMLFFGFCPVGLKATHDLPRQARIAALEDQVEQLEARERVAESLGLMGMAKETARVRRQQEREIKTGETRVLHENGGCYSNGMRALRAAVLQMFFTLRAKDVRRMRMSKEQTENWRSWIQETGEPPQALIDEMRKVADDEGKVVHFYDSDNFLAYPAMPRWFLGDDPESLAERAALRQSKKVRQQWGHDYKAATPADASEFQRTLTADQRRRVTEFLERNRRTTSTRKRQGFTLEEIASLANVPFRSAEAAAFQRRSAEQFARNPDDDWSTEIAQDHGLITALWKTDLD
jgi:hypothetical protein